MLSKYYKAYPDHLNKIKGHALNRNIFVLPKPYQAACLRSLIFVPLVTIICTASSCQQASDIFQMKMKFEKKRSEILLFYIKFFRLY